MATEETILDRLEDIEKHYNMIISPNELNDIPENHPLREYIREKIDEIDRLKQEREERREGFRILDQINKEREEREESNGIITDNISETFSQEREEHDGVMSEERVEYIKQEVDKQLRMETALKQRDEIIENEPLRRQLREENNRKIKKKLKEDSEERQRIERDLSKPIDETRQVTVTTDINRLRQINKNAEIDRFISDNQKKVDITLLSEQQIIKSYMSIPQYIFRKKKEYDEYKIEKKIRLQKRNKNKK